MYRQQHWIMCACLCDGCTCNGVCVRAYAKRSVWERKDVRACCRRSWQHSSMRIFFTLLSQSNIVHTTGPSPSATERPKRRRRLPRSRKSTARMIANCDWNWSWSIARLKEYLRRKRGHSRLLFKKAEFLNAKYLSIVTWHTHCVYNPGALPSATWKKSLLAQTSPALQPLPSPCFLPASESECHHLVQTPKDDGGGKHHAFSQWVSVFRDRTLTWETYRPKKNTNGTVPAFGKCLAFLGFKELVDGRVHRLLGTSMKANIFLREDVLPMDTTVLLGTRKFYQSAWRMVCKKALPELIWPLKTMR